MPVFISHSTKDIEIVKELREIFHKSEIETWDPETMNYGDLPEQLRAAIDKCEVCVFLATDQSIRSPWCSAELGAFWGLKRPVIIFDPEGNIDDKDLAPQFGSLLRIKDKDKLIENVKQELQSKPLFFGRTWEERQRMNMEIADEMRNARKHIDIHDSLLSKPKGHFWEKGITEALDRGISVCLILADPKSDVYRKRHETVSSGKPSGEWPEHLIELAQEYPSKFQLRPTDQLFSGPFVWIDRTTLFVGFFAPGIHSDDAPFMELRKSERTGIFFRELGKWVKSRGCEGSSEDTTNDG